MTLLQKYMIMLFGKDKMSYIIRKKDSPYYVRDMKEIIDANFDIVRWETTFTDVKKLITLKIKNRKDALNKIKILKETFPLDIGFEIERDDREK